MACSKPASNSKLPPAASAEMARLKSENLRLQNAAVELNEKIKTLEKQQTSNPEGGVDSENAAQLKSQVELLQKELQKTKEDFNAYRTKYRLESRQDAAGKVFNSLTAKDGKTYLFVVVQEANEIGIKIAHQSGEVWIPYGNLDASTAEQLGLDPAETEAPIPSPETLSALAQTLAANSPAITRNAQMSREDIEKEISKLRQELRDEISRILTKMKDHRREHYKDAGDSNTGTYIKLSSWNEKTQQNAYGGKRPKSLVDYDSGFDSQYPENSACIDSVKISPVFDKAKNLRTQILVLKTELGP